MTDPFTPFFLPWRARLAAARRALPRTDPRAPGPQQLEALFTPRLPRHWLSPEADGDCSRQRDWPLRRTCWTFLAQVLSPGSACRAAVRQAQTAARLEQRPVPRDDTSAYGQARLRLPLARLHELLERVARTLEQRVPASARGCGRVVKVADGSSVTALDTPANQQAFPQSADQKPGCGFPLVRRVVMFSLASGALLGFETGPYLQSELALATGLWALLVPGDGLLADRNCSCYRVRAGVVARQADAVCRLHASRRADLRFGHRGGRLDRQVVWTRPKAVPPGMNAAQWLALPATLTVRWVRFRVEEKGVRTRSVTLVTTLLDGEQFPVSALAALYRQRWQVELSLRQLKTALAMEHLAVRTPAMIARTLAMPLLAYQLIRGLMQEAALTWD